MTAPSDNHSNIFVGSSIAYVPSEDFPPHKALEYIIAYHPQFLQQALNNPYIMSSGDTASIRALYKNPAVWAAVQHLDECTRPILSTVFRCDENTETARLRQDLFYL
jgi:hypothetical protein